MTFSERVSKMIEIIKDSRLALIAKGETVPYDDDIPNVIEQMSGGGQDTQQLINLLEYDEKFSLIVPDGCTAIGESVFANNQKLTSIVIPDSVTTIGYDAFMYCINLTSVSLPTSLITIDYGAFYGCDSLINISIPNGVTTIGESAFSGCHSIEYIEIPYGITRININSFSDCRGLRNVIIPATVIDIGFSAFNSCTSLTSIVIPNSVMNIDRFAFSTCRTLASIDLTAYIDPSAIPVLSNTNAFTNNASGRKFIVANAEMKAAFSAATNWSSYASNFITAEEAAQNA